MDENTTIEPARGTITITFKTIRLLTEVDIPDEMTATGDASLFTMEIHDPARLMERYKRELEAFHDGGGSGPLQSGPPIEPTEIDMRSMRLRFRDPDAQLMFDEPHIATWPDGSLRGVVRVEITPDPS